MLPFSCGHSFSSFSGNLRFVAIRGLGFGNSLTFSSGLSGLEIVRVDGVVADDIDRRMIGVALL
jgi:hypothetical protein